MLGGGSIRRFCSGKGRSGEQHSQDEAVCVCVCVRVCWMLIAHGSIQPTAFHFIRNTLSHSTGKGRRASVCRDLEVDADCLVFQVRRWREMSSDRMASPRSSSRQSSSLSSSPMRQVAAAADVCTYTRPRYLYKYTHTATISGKQHSNIITPARRGHRSPFDYVSSHVLFNVFA